jgi:hypothetical protein
VKKGVRTEPTVDELVSMLRHSSLPTLVVEGDEDVVAFRCLEERFCSIQLSVLRVGGRPNLLAVFGRRGELPRDSVAFIADRDMWVYGELPLDYRSPLIAFTHGYSLENDVFMDGEIEKMMSIGERERFLEEVERFVEWFALAVNRLICGSSDERLDFHPNAILDGGVSAAVELQPGETYPSALQTRIKEDYARLIRGKSLLALAVRQLSYPGRAVRHHHLSLIEVTANRPGALLQSLHQHVATVFAPHFDHEPPL